MKKILFVVTCALITSSIAWAVDFSPSQLKLTGPKVIQYGFDGSAKEIPITVSGTPSGTIFLIYTKGMADKVIGVRNGFLGWHYVNKIDTCVYFSGVNSFEIGSQVITWNGKDNDGNMVPAGEYTYYLWGFDNSSTRQVVSRYILNPSGSGGQQATIVEDGPDYLPMANPIWYSKYSYEKWVIGNDPEDKTLIETIDVASVIPGWEWGAVLCFEPGNYSNFFIEAGKWETGAMGVRKLKWVPNGTAEIITDWGEDGQASFSGVWDVDPGVVTDGQYLITTNNQYHFKESAVGEMYIIDMDAGTIIKEIDLTPWWSSVADAAIGGNINGGPNGIYERDGYVYLGSHASCLRQKVNPLAEDEADFVVWGNTNGDYVFDINYLPDSPRAWACNDYNSPTQVWNIDPDDNGFVVGAPVGLAATFGLLGPDGTGIGYFAASGETTCWRFFSKIVDSGSAYDGLYVDFQASGSNEVIWKPDEFVSGIYYLGQDSFKGIISSKAVVDDEAPAGFSVEQNSPNPFNPTTTISFTIQEAGNVSIDIFNVAGQKVDTIVNEMMNAGIHSVTWNAFSMSAGVYFYTVKTGNIAETKKMTLLK